MNNKNFSEEESRTVRVIGAEAQEKLRRARVAVFGVGGVGGHICEALARAGVGAIDIFDRDCVSLSNINRQIIALHSTVGRSKVEVMRERILDINPHCRVTSNQVFYLPENADDFDLSEYDFIADAVDTVAAKIELAVRATDKNIPIISAMGAGNKLSPDRFCVTDLYKTTTDPLARVMRRELKARGIKKLRVVCSDEPPTAPHPDSIEDGRAVPGSLSFVPSVMGLIMAGEIIKELIK
ncbi:MAG: tRNA threonylcarbamoyladenosine dehydratase [Clostridia bacterium]|nr:tRNA threonylcarbamoyladenosine dehydratase [Clostridia bacterium]